MLLKFGDPFAKPCCFRKARQTTAFRCSCLMFLPTTMHEEPLIRQIKPFLSGSYAYLISSPAAAKALDLSKTIVAPVDDFLFSPLSPFTNGVFAYRVIPALVTTDEVTIVSTIGNRVSELSRSPWWIRHHPYRTYVKAKVWLNRLTAHREIIRAVD